MPSHRCGTASTTTSRTSRLGSRRVVTSYSPSLHRHGGLVHDHPHPGPHRHLPPRWRRSRPLRPAGRDHDHGHSHGLVDRSVVRSREGLRAVGLSLAILGLAAVAQLLLFIATNSIALLADLIHNFGDAATAIPLGVAFALRSARAERWAGLAVVLAIFVSACVAGVEAFNRLLHPARPEHLLALAGAGAIGYVGNWLAARVRLRAGASLDSPALVADGHHAQADAYVSLGVIAS